MHSTVSTLGEKLASQKSKLIYVQEQGTFSWGPKLRNMV